MFTVILNKGIASPHLLLPNMYVYFMISKSIQRILAVPSHLLETQVTYSKYAKSIADNLRISLSCSLMFITLIPSLNLLSDNFFSYLVLPCTNEFGVKEEMMSGVIFRKKTQQKKLGT